MNRILFLFINLMIVNFAYSQEEEKKNYETIFGSDFKNSGYLGILAKGTLIIDNNALEIGGRFAWIINQQYTIGLGLSSNVSDSKYKYKDTFDTKVKQSYTGIFLGYIIKPNSPIHFSVNAMFGWGNIKFDDGYYGYYVYDPPYYYYNPAETSFFVIEPFSSVDFNLTKNFRISLEASYKFIKTTGSNDSYKLDKVLTNKNYNSLSAGLVFQIGFF